MNLDDLLQRFLAEQKISLSVTVAICGSWPKFVCFCRAQGLVSVEEITPGVLEDFHKSLLWGPNEKGHWYKANTVDQFLRRVRQVLRWGAAHGLMDQDPTVGLLLPRPVQPVPQTLTWEQLQTLLASPDRQTPIGLRDALLLQVLTESPLPVTQVVALTEESVRQLELAATTWQLLAEYLEHGRPFLAIHPEETALFLGRMGHPLSWPAVAARLNEMARQAGLGKRLPTRILHQSYLASLKTLRDRHPSDGFFFLTEPFN